MNGAREEGSTSEWLIGLAAGAGFMFVLGIIHGAMLAATGA